MLSISDVVAGVSLASLIAAVMKIIDLKKTADENKKTLLEIDQLKREKAELENRIVPASDADIAAYASLKTKIDRNVAESWRNPRRQRRLKPALIILPLLCCLLGIVSLTYFTKNQAANEPLSVAANGTIMEFSNQLMVAGENLSEFKAANVTLAQDLASSQQQLALSTAQLEPLSNRLATVSALLNSSLTQWNTNRGDSQNALGSGTNSEFLQAELEKQLAAKAELERKFNDLDELRAQIRKIELEMFIARRLWWMKNSNGDKKGAELLLPHPAVSTNATLPDFDSNLKVSPEKSPSNAPPVIQIEPSVLP
jgi:hypothetical protein